MGCSSEFVATRKEFIERWGKISSSWGVCKSMAQVHALLLISAKPMSATCIMEELDISSGGVNTHLRELVDWGLVYKCQNISGRKDYYHAEKDLTKVFRQIIINRKKRELDPIIELLNQVEHQKASCPDSEEFVKVVSEIRTLSTQLENTLDSILNTDQQWMVNALFRLAH